MSLHIATFDPTTWFMLAAILLPLAWLVSEFKGNRWHRITFGVLALVFLSFTVSEIRLIIPKYTAVFQHSCIQRANDLLKMGKTQAVIKHYDEYLTATTNTFSFYDPAMKLGGKLYKEIEQSSNQPSDRTR